MVFSYLQHNWMEGGMMGSIMSSTMNSNMGCGDMINSNYHVSYFSLIRSTCSQISNIRQSFYVIVTQENKNAIERITIQLRKVSIFS